MGYVISGDFYIDTDTSTILQYKGKRPIVEIPRTYKDNAGHNRRIVHIGDSAFKEKKIITEVYIPRGIKSIGGWAFFGCENLEKVEIQEGGKMESIEERAFYNCLSLEHFDFTKVPYIDELGEFAFAHTKLGKVDLSNIKHINTIKAGAFMCSDIKDLILSEQITVIEDHAFVDNHLTEADLPNVTYVGDFAFARNSIKLIDLSNVESIGKYAFRENNKVKSIKINPYVIEIGEYAFDDCIKVGVESLWD